MQTHHANRKRTAGEHYLPGDLVYLLTKNLALPKGRAKKLLPKFIGPYKVVEVHTPASTVTLELPPELTTWWVHPMFHMSLIRAHVPNDDRRLPRRDTKLYYDFRATDEPEWFVNEILAHRWVGQENLEFQVCWTLGDGCGSPLPSVRNLKP